MSVVSYRSITQHLRISRARRAMGWVITAYVCAAGIVSASGAVESAPVRATPTAARVDSSECSSCHVFSKTLSHPVGVTPSMRVPDSMPLEEGRVTCLTCHDGAMASGHSERRSTGQDFLRGSEFAESLCSKCHGETKSRTPHASEAMKAHLNASTKTNGVERLDAESLACMGCHDGTAASDAGANHTKGMGGMDDRFPSDHPIGIALDVRKPDREDGRMKSKNMIDSRVRLFGGTVGCGSCHSVYSKHEKLLVMSNQRSALCVACHEM